MTIYSSKIISLLFLLLIHFFVVWNIFLNDKSLLNSGDDKFEYMYHTQNIQDHWQVEGIWRFTSWITNKHFSLYSKFTWAFILFNNVSLITWVDVQDLYLYVNYIYTLIYSLLFYILLSWAAFKNKNISSYWSVFILNFFIIFSIYLFYYIKWANLYVWFHTSDLNYLLFISALFVYQTKSLDYIPYFLLITLAMVINHHQSSLVCVFLMLVLVLYQKWFKWILKYFTSHFLLFLTYFICIWIYYLFFLLPDLNDLLGIFTKVSTNSIIKAPKESSSVLNNFAYFVMPFVFFLLKSRQKNRWWMLILFLTMIWVFQRYLFKSTFFVNRFFVVFMIIFLWLISWNLHKLLFTNWFFSKFFVFCLFVSQLFLISFGLNTYDRKINFVNLPLDYIDIWKKVWLVNVENELTCFSDPWTSFMLFKIAWIKQPYSYQRPTSNYGSTYAKEIPLLQQVFSSQDASIVKEILQENWYNCLIYDFHLSSIQSWFRHNGLSNKFRWNLDARYFKKLIEWNYNLNENNSTVWLVVYSLTE